MNELDHSVSLSSLLYRGVDISSLPEIEDNGGKYYDNGTETDLIVLLKNHGINYIRLRLWHTPSDEYCNLENTIEMAKRIKAAGLQLLLDFHYSDRWADPGNQIKPESWVSMSHDELKAAVYDYTKEVLMRLKNEGVTPDMVQIGNEITPGMLWDDGRVGGSFDNDSQWLKFTNLLKAGIKGVSDSLIEGESIKIMLHIDRGGNNPSCQWFFDNILLYNVSFDVIGLSYYPWWHGGLSDLQANLEDLATRYQQKICVVETAYPWTLDWYDYKNNQVGLENQLLEGYPANVEGQTAYLHELISIIQQLPSSKGIGLFYWEPACLSTPTLGSSRENLGFFNFQGNLLDSINVFCTDQETSSSTALSTTISESVATQAKTSSLSTPNIGVFGLISVLLFFIHYRRNIRKDT